MKELGVDARLGLFVDHDLAGYQVPVYADILHQEIVFLEEADDKADPKAGTMIAEADARSGLATKYGYTVNAVRRSFYNPALAGQAKLRVEFA